MKRKFWIVFSAIVGTLCLAFGLAGCNSDNGASESSLGLTYTLINHGNEYEVSGIGDCTDTDLIIANNYKANP